MPKLNIGDIVDLYVTKVTGYACWGTTHGMTGFSHCVDWSEEKPVPDSCHPVVGQTIKVRVFHLSNQATSDLPQDVSFGGTIHVDFGCSIALLDDDSWSRYNKKKKA